MKLMIPPTMRFLTELATWTWLLLAAIFVCWGFGLLLPLSLLSLAILNFPGDKRSTDSKGLGFAVPGWTRISVEILSAGLGLFAAYFYGQFLYMGIVIFLPQLGITLIAFALDFKRWMWMLGKWEHAPDYVTTVHKTTEK